MFHDSRLTPVARRLVRKRRFKGPLEGCSNDEPHAWAKCKQCVSIYNKYGLQKKPPTTLERWAAKRRA